MLPGETIEVRGLGDRFSGTAWVSGIRHEIRNGQWITIARTGTAATWFAKRPDISMAPASGLLPGVRGMVNGIVKKIDEDPKNEFRVQVEIPVLGDEAGLLWARFTSPYATSDAGIFFYPEVGDEVLLGFLNQDPRFPIIMGSLHSSTRAPALTPTEGNPQKAITSKSKIQLIFDDEKVVLSAKTPNGNSIVLSDEEQSITVSDQNGNTIKMSESGIEISSATSMSLKAPEGITMQSEAQVSITGTESVSVNGASISLTADESLSASGGMSSSLTSGGETSINGTMVLIN